ncbi:hypothetical protein SEA_SHADOW1_74 [Mycobacterium phage Shadow1]|nr:hypothetical protein SEA_SHADOW1_74 [Mycobacterium phage Shadow1]
MRPSQAALANGADLFSKVFCAEQIEQIQHGFAAVSVLTFAQVKAYKDAFRTDRTDIYGLTSRVEIRGVLPGRVSLGAVCGADMQKSVLSVLPPAAAKSRRVIGGPRFDEALTGRN